MTRTREVEFYYGRDGVQHVRPMKPEEITIQRGDLTFETAEEIEFAFKLWFYWGALHGSLSIRTDTYPLWFVIFVYRQTDAYKKHK